MCIFFREVSSRFTSDECWKGAKVCPMLQIAINIELKVGLLDAR